jgi:hypothetical protein
MAQVPSCARCPNDFGLRNNGFAFFGISRCGFNDPVALVSLGVVVHEGKIADRVVPGDRAVG